MKYFTFTLLLIFYAILPSFAGNIAKTRLSITDHLYTTADGLSSSLVNGLIQDSDGYIWIATGYGLCRYDGHVFRTFHVKSNLVDNTSCDEVTAIAQLDRHNLFVGTFDGLFIFNTKYETFNSVTTGKGIKSLRWNPVREAISLGSGRVLCHAGNLGWLVVNADGVAKAWYRQPKIQPTAICWLSKHQLYLGSEHGLYIYDIQTDKLSAVPQTSHLLIASLWVSRKGALLVGTDSKGLYSLTFSSPCLKKLPYDGKIHAVMEDTDGAMWLGMYQRGIYYASTKAMPFGLIPTDGQWLGKSSAISLLADSNNTLWVGTDGEGLYAIRPNKNSLRHYSPKDKGMPATIMSVTQTPGGDIYVGSYQNGAVRLDTVTGRIYPLDCTLAKGCSHVFRLVADHKGRLWIATLGGGLICYNIATGHVERWNTTHADKYHRLSSDYCVDLALDKRHNRLWVAMARGLACVELSSGRLLSTSKAAQSIAYNALTLAPDGSLLLGSHEGVVMIGRNDIVHYATRNGLPNDNVLALGLDNSRHLWVATEEGLSMLSMKGGTPSSGLVLSRKALNGQEFSTHAMTLLADGRMAIAGTRGVTIITPHLLLNNGQRLHRPILTCVQAGGELFASDVDDSVLRIPYNRRSITISVSSLAYGMLGGVTYRYSINGQPWQSFPSGSNELSLPMLSPGNYDLKVVAEASGVKSDPMSLRVHVAFPWWSSWWFLGICLAVILLLIWLWRRERKQQVRRRQMMQEQLHALQIYEKRINRLTSENDNLKSQRTELMRQALASQKEKNKPNEESALPVGDHLLRNVLQLINSRYNDSSLDVEWLAQKCCMSRSQLFRKVKSLTGLSPSELIRDVRLQRAAQLLAEGGISAKDAAYSCGFESPSYFSRAFKSRYGLSPTEYMQK